MMLPTYLYTQCQRLREVNRVPHLVLPSTSTTRERASACVGLS